MPDATPGPIVHDAEYYVLFDQHGDAWAVEDAELDARLTELEATHGAKPNIVHVMWDDMAFGDAGIHISFDRPTVRHVQRVGVSLDPVRFSQ